MQKFLSFFAFVTNSLVFILLGFILSSMNMYFLSLLPVLSLTIGVVVIARAVSIYIPIGILNLLRVEEHIPLSWQHLLSWGSLRGALAVMMVLLIPEIGENGYEKLVAFEYAV